MELTLITISIVFTFVAAILIIVWYGTKDLGGRGSDF